MLLQRVARSREVKANNCDLRELIRPGSARIPGAKKSSNVIAEYVLVVPEPTATRHIMHNVVTNVQ